MSRIPDSVGLGNGPTPHSPRERVIDLDSEPPPLRAIVRGEEVEINPQDLQSANNIQLEDVLPQIREAWSGAEQPIVFDIGHLLDWTEDVRSNVFRFISSLDVAYVVRCGDSEGDLLTAVLGLMEPHDDIRRCERGRSSALHAAVLQHPDVLPTACSQISAQLRRLGVSNCRADSLLAEARRMLRSLRPAGNSVTAYVTDVLPDAPVREQTKVPTGWHVGRDGIRRENVSDDYAHINVPIVIPRRLVNLSDGSEFLEIAWPRDGQWRHHVIERAKAARSRDVVDLAGYGAPVTSNNAKAVVDYLAAFEIANTDILPREHIANRIGWLELPAGGQIFLTGRQVITSRRQVNRESGDIGIRFRGGDSGDEQVVNGYRAEGSFDAWSKAMASLAEFPYVMLAVYASLCPPLLAVLDTFNFVVSYAGPTSVGKTVSLRFGASCWGCPDERDNFPAVRKWDSSRTFIQRVAAVQCDHPLILDESEGAHNQAEIAKTIYDICTGQGRGRGSIEGIRTSDTCRTVLISSGEVSLTSFTKQSGTRARVIECWGSPFRRTDAGIASLVARVDEAVKCNFGHAGPRLVRYLLQHQSQWMELRQQYQQLRSSYAARAGDNSVAGRMAAHFAALDMTSRLARQANVVPWHDDCTISDVWTELIAGTGDADQAAAALRYVWSWTCSHEQEFYGPRNQNAPAGGYAGRWDGQGGAETDWEFVGFYAHKLEEILRHEGYEPDAIVRTWRDRGWLRVTPRRGTRYRTRSGRGHPEDLIAITRAAIYEVLGEEG